MFAVFVGIPGFGISYSSNIEILGMADSRASNVLFAQRCGLRRGEE